MADTNDSSTSWAAVGYPKNYVFLKVIACDSGVACEVAPCNRTP
jgi:hypothetical protein